MRLFISRKCNELTENNVNNRLNSLINRLNESKHFKQNTKCKNANYRKIRISPWAQLVGPALSSSGHIQEYCDTHAHTIGILRIGGLRVISANYANHRKP